jgi:hypothetical protein
MAEVTDINKYKQSKELSNGRKPLYVSHLTGKITGGEDFPNRLQNIRDSLAKVANLMDKLKQLQEDYK